MFRERPFVTLKKNKGNEKVLKPNKELVHADLHLSKESSMDGDSLWVASNGDFTKVVVIKARLPNSFAWKETKTKRMHLWLHQIEAYMET